MHGAFVAWPTLYKGPSLLFAERDGYTSIIPTGVFGTPIPCNGPLRRSRREAGPSQMGLYVLSPICFVICLWDPAVFAAVNAAVKDGKVMAAAFL